MPAIKLLLVDFVFTDDCVGSCLWFLLGGKRIRS